MNVKYITITIVVLLVLVAGWYFFVRDGGPSSISNPPTAEELERIEAIEQSRLQKDPDAKTGVGVRPVGSIPPEPEPVIETATTSTSTATSTEE